MIQRGSSPRVRGTRAPPHAVERGPRFIPACAGNSGRCSRPTSRPAVHPRVCGELALQAPWPETTPGSSPRVRGTHVVGRRLAEAGRFIPACAGNSRGAGGAASAPAVHPRVCGELSASRLGRPALGGSSPRVRGTRVHGCDDCSLGAVHPRVCGELSRRSRRSADTGGSSPRVRGTRRTVGVGSCRSPVHPRVCGELLAEPAVLLLGRRFIPACAGNSTPSSASFEARIGSSPRVRGTRDHSSVPGVRENGSSPRVRGTQGRGRGGGGRRAVHPRVCGELCRRGCRPKEIDGSSPRVRGTRAAGAAEQVEGRFIPACAGNSSSTPIWWCTATVHPRVCGELVVNHTASVHGNGSSPRVRGTPTRPTGPREQWAVHPRVCGELNRPSRTSGAPSGSSPRVRGTLANGGFEVRGFRFIPACAGNSHAKQLMKRWLTVHPRVCGELQGE